MSLVGFVKRVVRYHDVRPLSNERCRYLMPLADAVQSFDNIRRSPSRVRWVRRRFRWVIHNQTIKRALADAIFTLAIHDNSFGIYSHRTCRVRLAWVRWA